jgi:hypothetical protein
LRILALIVALSLPTDAYSSGAALAELARAAGIFVNDAGAPARPAPVVPTAGNIRFCAFSGGRAGVRGELRAFFLQPPVQANVPNDAAVPIFDQGVLRPEARAKARALLAEMLAQTPAPVMESLLHRRVFLVIIPLDKKLTDLPQFRALRGAKLPDGRVWDDIRGVGFVSQDDGTVAVGAGEENFLGDAVLDRYPKGFLLAHEFSHAVHGYGLPSEEARSIHEEYRARVAAGLQFPSAYASVDEFEYFAVSASSFFDRRLVGSDPEREIGWIRQNDAAMFGLLGRVYGSPRALWSEEPAPR